MSATVKRIILKTPAAVGSTGEFSALERCRTYSSGSKEAAAIAQASSQSAQVSSTVAGAARDAALAAVGAVKASPTDMLPTTLDQALAVAAPLSKAILSPGEDETLSLSVEAMTGATAENAGRSGVVPVPRPGDQARFLRGDGSWSTLDRQAVGMAEVEDTWTALTGPVTVLSAKQAALPGNQCGLLPDGRAIKPNSPVGASGYVSAAVYDSQNLRTLVTVSGFSLSGQSTVLSVGQDPRNAPESSSAGADLYLASIYNSLNY